MKHLTLTIFTSLLIISILSCSNDKPLSDQPSNVASDSNEVRLGESNYYLKISANFKITEARGKEGQLGYHIISKDSSSQMSGYRN